MSLAGTIFEQNVQSNIARSLYLSDQSDKYFGQIIPIITAAVAAAAATSTTTITLEVPFFAEMLQMEDEYAACFVESPYRRAQHFVAKELGGGGGGLYTLHGRQIIMVMAPEPEKYFYKDKYQRLV